MKSICQHIKEYEKSVKKEHFIFNALVSVAFRLKHCSFYIVIRQFGEGKKVETKQRNIHDVCVCICLCVVTTCNKILNRAKKNISCYFNFIYDFQFTVHNFNDLADVSCVVCQKTFYFRANEVCIWFLWMHSF